MCMHPLKAVVLWGTLLCSSGESGLPWWPSSKESTCQRRRQGFDPWSGKIPWRRKWQLTPVFLPGKPMDRGAWWATVHGVTRVRCSLASKQQQLVEYSSTLPSPPPLAPLSRESPCRYTWFQTLHASCCIVLLYFSRYCSVRFKMFSIFLCLFAFYLLFVWKVLQPHYSIVA